MELPQHIDEALDEYGRAEFGSTGSSPISNAELYMLSVPCITRWVMTPAILTTTRLLMNRMNSWSATTA